MTHPLQSIMHEHLLPENPSKRSPLDAPFGSELDGPVATGLANAWVVLGGDGATGPTGSTGPTDAAGSQGSISSAGATGAPKRKPLCGGVYTPEEALALLNSYFFIGKNNQETAVFRVNDDGSAAFMQPEQFKLAIQNIFVEYSDRPNKPIPAEKFWKESPHRREREIVFKPRGTTDPREFNLWRGFGVEPRKGWQKQRRLLRHIREVICRRDKNKFKYLIRYLAWSVQTPDKHSGVVIMLKSRKQGTGKSTLGKVMLDIFGQHGALIDDKERLLGRFTDWLENVCFVLAEEILWAGDHKAADKLKSILTADTIQIERKFGSLRQIPNRLKTIATTNHDHAIAAGVRERRNVVFDVSDDHTGDKGWFDRLYQDLDAGGTSEFLDFLLHIKLGDWHPREILKTAETIEQQRMSGDSVSQWSQGCIEADAIIGDGSRQYELGTRIARNDLCNAYDGYCKQRGLRPANGTVFGSACNEMFGPRQRMHTVPVGPAPQSIQDTGAPDAIDAALDQQIATTQASAGAEPASAHVTGKNSRPWGWDVPDGDQWQEKIDVRLGIKK